MVTGKRAEKFRKWPDNRLKVSSYRLQMAHANSLDFSARFEFSPNQVLTHAARAAANQVPLVAARGAREGLWSE